MYNIGDQISVQDLDKHSKEYAARLGLDVNMHVKKQHSWVVHDEPLKSRNVDVKEGVERRSLGEPNNIASKASMSNKASRYIRSWIHDSR